MQTDDRPNSARTVSARLAEGFPRQQMMVLPRPVIQAALARPVTSQLLPTDVGLFPSAEHHYVERQTSIRQAILIYCARGRGWAEVNGRRGVVRENECLILPPGQTHAYGADDRRPWTIYWCHAAGTGVMPLLDVIGNDGRYPMVLPGEPAALVPLFEQLISILKTGYDRPSLMTASLVLGHLFGEFIAGRGASTATTDVHQRLDDVVAYMRKQVRSTVRLTELAAITHLSPSHFAAVFKRKTGYAVLDYFTRLKVQLACERLDLTATPVSVIATELGYADALYFSRVFRRVMGMSPRAYRAIHKG